jgi:alkylation response protein AidB-like acyl-CoA dehydrogenase
MRRDLYEPDHEAFREVVHAYVKREVTPNQQRWEQEHIVDRQAWLAAGKQAIIGHLIPERFGGLGTRDFLCRAKTGTRALNWYFLLPLACSAVLADQALDDLSAPDPGGQVDGLAGLMQRWSLFP